MRGKTAKRLRKEAAAYIADSSSSASIAVRTVYKAMKRQWKNRNK
jgi:hypothetical protein